METSVMQLLDKNRPSNVSTLPIRNGNLRNLADPLVHRTCKYFTYKEWKLITSSIGLVLVIDFSKYLTYKEWKHHVN